MKSRHKARAVTLASLYSMDFNKRFYDAQGKFIYADDPSREDCFVAMSQEEKQELEQEVIDYSRLLLLGTLENLQQIDQRIQQYSKRELQDIALVDRNILRLSVYTLMFCTDVHPHVVIDEAVKLSQEYSSEVNYRFINGILDAMVKDI